MESCPLITDNGNSLANRDDPVDFSGFSRLFPVFLPCGFEGIRKIKKARCKIFISDKRDYDNMMAGMNVGKYWLIEGNYPQGPSINGMD